MMRDKGPAPASLRRVATVDGGQAMTLTRCFDAAFPPAQAPSGAGAVLGYVGGPAEHVWTVEEWQRFAHLRQFPCWICAVGGQVEGDPDVAAREAAAAVLARGWHHGRAIVGDMETSTDRGWWAAWAGRVRALGFVPVAYGSRSAVLELGAANMWVASWDRNPVLPAGWRAKQYMPGADMDWSVVGPELMSRGGVGPRR